MAETPVIWTDAWIAQTSNKRRKELRFVNSSTYDLASFSCS